jgi:hypothetical protein
MDLAPVEEEISTRDRTNRKNPGKCEQVNCESTHRVGWCGKVEHKKFYCAAHKSRAAQDRTMDAPIRSNRRGKQQESTWWKTSVAKTFVAKTFVAKTFVAKTSVAKTSVAKTSVAKTSVAKTSMAKTFVAKSWV